MTIKHRNASNTHPVLAAFRLSIWLPFHGFEEWRREQDLPVNRGRRPYTKVVKRQIEEDIRKLLAEKYGVTNVEFWY